MPLKKKKKTRGGLGQPGVFFPLADHAIAAHYVVPPGCNCNVNLIYGGHALSYTSTKLS